MPYQYSFVIILGPGLVYAYGTDTIDGIERRFNECRNDFIRTSPLLLISEEDGTGY